MAGILYGVGVGPGDGELLTLKAVKTIQKCEVIGIPDAAKDGCIAYGIIKDVINDIDKKEILPVTIPMTKDRQKLDAAYDKGVASIVRLLQENKNIAFLNLGDPVVYGTYMQLHERVINAGFNAVLVNGVTSFCAVAAELGIALASRRERIHIIPGVYTASEYDNIRNLLMHGATVVIMKSGGELPAIKNVLCRLEEEGICKSYAVTDCGMSGEVIYRNITELDADAGYFTTIIVKAVNGWMKQSVNG